jgi:hypothetical protein
MRELGGPEATAYFAETRESRIDKYRKPLGDFEDIATDRWDELTVSSRRSYMYSLVTGGVFFIVGLIVVAVGLILLIKSNDQTQMAAGAIMSGLTAIAGMLTRFWHQPVETVQRFSAQQARLQAAFIGYMNRVAQVRLVFESHYGSREVEIDQLQQYQAMLHEAIAQAASQLADPPPAPSHTEASEAKDE